MTDDDALDSWVEYRVRYVEDGATRYATAEPPHSYSAASDLADRFAALTVIESRVCTVTATEWQDTP